jgi:hypothetical protein
VYDHQTYLHSARFETSVSPITIPGLDGDTATAKTFGKLLLYFLGETIIEDLVGDLYLEILPNTAAMMPANRSGELGYDGPVLW